MEEHLETKAKRRRVDFVEVCKSNEIEGIDKVYASDDPFFRLIGSCKDHENTSSHESTLSRLQLIEKYKKNEIRLLSLEKLTDNSESRKSCASVTTPKTLKTKKELVFSHDFVVGKDSVVKSEASKPKKELLDIASKKGTENVNKKISEDVDDDSSSISSLDIFDDSSLSDSDSYDTSSSEQSTNKIEYLRTPPKSNRKAVSSNSKKHLKDISAACSAFSQTKIGENDGFSVNTLSSQVKDDYRKYKIKPQDFYYRKETSKVVQQTKTPITSLKSLSDKCGILHKNMDNKLYLPKISINSEVAKSSDEAISAKKNNNSNEQVPSTSRYTTSNTPLRSLSDKCDILHKTGLHKNMENNISNEQVPSTSRYEQLWTDLLGTI